MKDLIGRVNVQIEGLLGSINIDVEAVEIVPGAVVDALLDGRHGSDALHLLVRIGATEHLPINDDGDDGRVEALHDAINLIDALAVALREFLPLVEVFPFTHNRGAFGKLNVLPVAEETAVGAVDLFLYHETGSNKSVIADLFHEGLVEPCNDLQGRFWRLTFALTKIKLLWDVTSALVLYSSIVFQKRKLNDNLSGVSGNGSRFRK